jgi:hypothetical protein
MSPTPAAPEDTPDQETLTGDDLRAAEDYRQMRAQDDHARLTAPEVTPPDLECPCCRGTISFDGSCGDCGCTPPNREDH